MPRIYRPETDNQRVQAMQAAKLKYDATDAAQRAFSADTYARLNVFLPLYRTEIQQRGTALSQQANATSGINGLRRRMRLYVSHFIIGLDNAILREELPASARPYYQLDVNGGPLPKLTTDEDLVQWAQNVIDGESARVNEGGNALSNPTAQQVQDQLDTYMPRLAQLTTLRSAYDREQEDVAALWNQADSILADVWDEVLFHYRRDEAPSLRRKAREWGVVYRPDKGETPSPADYSIKGIATDAATGLPMADVEVSLDGTTTTATTDSEGRYYLPATTAGSYTLRASKEGYATAAQPVTVTDGTIAEVNVALTPEGPEE